MSVPVPPYFLGYFGYLTYSPLYRNEPVLLMKRQLRELLAE
jgi:hypothetical protein